MTDRFTFKNQTQADRQEYKDHTVFKTLQKYIDFYDWFSFSVMGFTKVGTKGVMNIDSYVYSSMYGTLESIKLILVKGRAGDAFALLRKYHDSAILNIYTNLYLTKNHDYTKSFYVNEVTDWISGKNRLPHNTYGTMSEYIESSDVLKEVFIILNADKSYRETRTRCNDHTHYNYFDNVLVNDNNIHFPKRISLLDSFEKDLVNIFVLHLACILKMNDHYMMSSDYIDYLEMGMTPEPDSQYWVAQFIQDIFTDVITLRQPEVAKLIKENTAMHLV